MYDSGEAVRICSCGDGRVRAGIDEDLVDQLKDNQCHMDRGAGRRTWTTPFWTMISLCTILAVTFALIDLRAGSVRDEHEGLSAR